MVKLVFCCRRKQGLSRAEFQTRWLDVHGPLVRKLHAHLPMMKRYVQSHTVDDAINDPIRASRGTGVPYDGITEVWFDSLQDMGGDGSAAAIDAGEQLLRDESEFIDFAGSSVFVTEEHEIF